MVRTSTSHLHPNRTFLDIQLHHPSASASGHTTTPNASASAAAVAPLPPPSFNTNAPAANSSAYLSFAAQRSLSIPPPLRLTPPLSDPGCSTRVQLHRQRLHELHATRLVNPRSIPGFRTSAAFFGSLRTNLRLHAAPLPPSPMSSSPSMRGSTASLPPPSPLSGAVDSIMDMTEPPTPATPQPLDPLSVVPELQTYAATTDTDKLAALKLIADSIAQMRQTANQALIFHPLNLSLTVAFLALAARAMLDAGYDISIIATTAAGLIMCILAISRWLTQDYLFAAEALNWDFLGSGSDETGLPDDSVVLVTKFGDEVIAALVLGWVSGESRLKKQRKAWRGEVKAWTVRLKYRGKGVGGALLEEAVKEARKKGAEGIEFAEEHANSKRVLYDLYNSKFEARERKSRELLQDFFEASPVRGKKK